MFPNGKVQVSALVNKQTKERFDKIKKSCPLRNDAFINYLLNLYEGKDISINQNQESEEKDHE